MSQTAIEALIGLVGAVIGALAAFVIAARRLPSDMKLTEAQAEKTQHEAANMVINELRQEISRLKEKLSEFEGRLVKAESRATSAESRLADAEARANEFRRAVISVGERLDRERAKSRQMVIDLVGVIEYLLDCVENPTHSKDIDRPAITKLIQSILNGYPAEHLIKVD